MDLGLKGQTVLVTGSSSGIGRATAVAFGEEGARVAVTYHANREGGDETARLVRSAGGEAVVLRYDLADPDTIRTTIATIEQEWGGLNVLVNNAAPMALSAPTGQPFEQVPVERWEGMLHGVLDGVVVTLRLTTPEDVARLIVFLGSRANQQITGEVVRITGIR